MRLRTGVPLIDQLEALQASEQYRDPHEFNSQFLAKHGAALKKYGRHWGMDPFKLWSRRWEYPFTSGRIIDFCQNRPGDTPLKILDAGSGVTFFPYYICSRIPRAQFICCDYDASYHEIFRDVNANESQPPRVTFTQSMLQKLPVEDQSLDAVCCISVLEHTDNYGEIIDEFCRVLKPGGAFVLTFDLSLDGRFTLPKKTAAQLLEKLKTKFTPPDDVNLTTELDRMHDSGALTTDYVRKTQPDLLPWSLPAKIYKSVQDLFKGYGWTGGFRSRTVFCLDVRKPLR